MQPSRILESALYVTDLGAAEAFYRDLLGFDLMVHYPGASFMATGGYHHHIATNTWHSRGAGPRRENEAGLSSFELVPCDDEARAALSWRLAASGGDAASTVDPWGNRITLRS